MPDYRQWTHRWLPLVLALLLALPSGAAAQAPANQPATVRTLKVLPLAGNQELNDLQNKVMAPLVVQVLDQNDRPVEGADVIFRFPLNGPSASFSDQKTAQTFRTNADGQAAATGWAANGKVGTFQVQVTASRGSEQGSTTISMTNVTRITGAQKRTQRKGWFSRWGKFAVAAGAAGVVVAIVLATRGGSRVITATPGSPSIGAPQ
jgi:hypothetical protein